LNGKKKGCKVKKKGKQEKREKNWGVTLLSCGGSFGFCGRIDMMRQSIDARGSGVGGKRGSTLLIINTKEKSW